MSDESVALHWKEGEKEVKVVKLLSIDINKYDLFSIYIMILINIILDNHMPNI